MARPVAYVDDTFLRGCSGRTPTLTWAGGPGSVCNSGQHAVAVHGVKHVLPVDLHGDAAHGHSSAQGVADNLAAARNAHC
jgi:hypothetical protein